MGSKILVLGCDDAAFDFKQTMMAFLVGLGYVIEDVGIQSVENAEPYPDVAARVAQAVAESGGLKKGMLFCGTGIGMAITANKFAGIRAAVVHDSFSAERAALSNDANIITMGARVIGIELAKKLVTEWLDLEFQPGSSSPKLEAIGKIEQRNFK